MLARSRPRPADLGSSTAPGTANLAFCQPLIQSRHAVSDRPSEPQIRRSRPVAPCAAQVEDAHSGVDGGVAFRHHRGSLRSRRSVGYGNRRQLDASKQAIFRTSHHLKPLRTTSDHSQVPADCQRTSPADCRREAAATGRLSGNGAHVVAGRLTQSDRPADSGAGIPRPRPSSVDLPLLPTRHRGLIPHDRAREETRRRRHSRV